MRSRTLVTLLALAALTTLPGCVVSLFSDSKVSEDSSVRAEQLENRMDHVERVMQERASVVPGTQSR